MKKRLFGLFCLAGAVAIAPMTALGVPVLQLDIAGGSYDAASQTIITSDADFVLNAILTPGNDATEEQIAALLNQTFYISAAVTPAPEYPEGADFGSLGIDGVSVGVTGDMKYGTPPVEDNLEVLQPTDPGDISPHGIFPTYFTEVGFRFLPTLTTSTYNVAENPGGLDSTGTGSFYFPFQIATGDLTGAANIHFDLYNEVVRTPKAGGTDTDVAFFAPFSHDAETRKVPEPGMLPLLGMGLVGLAFLRRRSA